MIILVPCPASKLQPSGTKWTSPWELCHWYCSPHRGEDPQLKGVISLSSWRRICRNTTNLELDWILLARLVGGASVNNLRYMETLNRFAFKIASQAPQAAVAKGVVHVRSQLESAQLRVRNSSAQLRQSRVKWPALFWLLSTSRSCKPMTHCSSWWASFARQMVYILCMCWLALLCTFHFACILRLYRLV